MSERLKELQNKLYDYQTRAFMLLLEIIVIFGLPALIAVFLGKELGAEFGGGRTMIYILLPVAFIVSWLIMLQRIRKVGRDLNALQEEIRNEKARSDAQPTGGEGVRNK